MNKFAAAASEMNESRARVPYMVTSYTGLEQVKLDI
jgi:hypothetical protein